MQLGSPQTSFISNMSTGSPRKFVQMQDDLADESIRKNTVLEHGVLRLRGASNFRVWENQLLRTLECLGLAEYVATNLMAPRSERERATWTLDRKFVGKILADTLVDPSVDKRLTLRGWNRTEPNPFLTYHFVKAEYGGPAREDRENIWVRYVGLQNKSFESLFAYIRALKAMKTQVVGSAIGLDDDAEVHLWVALEGIREDHPKSYETLAGRVKAGRLDWNGLMDEISAMAHCEGRLRLAPPPHPAPAPPVQIHKAEPSDKEAHLSRKLAEFDEKEAYLNKKLADYDEKEVMLNKMVAGWEEKTASLDKMIAEWNEKKASGDDRDRRDSGIGLGLDNQVDPARRPGVETHAKAPMNGDTRQLGHYPQPNRVAENHFMAKQDEAPVREQPSPYVTTEPAATDKPGQVDTMAKNKRPSVAYSFPKTGTPEPAFAQLPLIHPCGRPRKSAAFPRRPNGSEIAMKKGVSHSKEAQVIPSVNVQPSVNGGNLLNMNQPAKRSEETLVPAESQTGSVSEDGAPLKRFVPVKGKSADDGKHDIPVARLPIKDCSYDADDELKRRERKQPTEAQPFHYGNCPGCGPYGVPKSQVDKDQSLGSESGPGGRPFQ